MNEELTYEDALRRLEELAAQMERDEIGLDELAPRLAEAQRLLQYCRRRLKDAEKNCKSLLNLDGKE